MSKMGRAPGSSESSSPFLTVAQGAASYSTVVNHGAVAGTARPAVAAPVMWVGSVAPTNAIANDVWWDTTVELTKRWSGSAWKPHGATTYATVGGAGRERAAWAVGRVRGQRNAVMTTPPTLSFGANGSYALQPTNGHAYGNAAVAADGRTVTLTDLAGSNNLGTVKVKSLRTRVFNYTNLGTQYFGSLFGSLSNTTSNQWTLEFGTDEAKPCIYMRNIGGGQVRVKVDGQYVSLTPSSVPLSWAGLLVIDFSSTLTVSTVSTANPGVVTTTAPHGLTSGDTVSIASVGGATQANGFWQVTVLSSATFSIPVNVSGTYTSGGTITVGYKPRHIEVETWLADPAQLVVGPSASIWAPTRDRGPRIYVISDSFGYGSNAVFPGFSSFVERLREATGIDDVLVDCAGSTGYLRTAGAGNNNFLNRVQSYASSVADSDLVIFCGSVNDAIYTQQQVTDQAALCYAACSPVKVGAVVFGSQNPLPAGQALVLAGVQAAMAAAPNGIGTLDLTTMLTGTGFGGSPTGVGNSDLLRSSDGTHPTQAGHDQIGRRIASWLGSTWAPLANS